MKCPACGELVPLMYLRKHERELCGNRRVRCRNHALGCGVMVRLKDRALHEHVDGNKAVRSALYLPSHGAHLAIGESLGASALRICGGIFTKIADIGSDLMKIVFKIKEDDARNPGVIADCTGDNAGDSVGPTADGFETYGVTGVALIAFITLAITGKLRLV